jgi:signal transduction histidine kinase
MKGRGNALFLGASLCCYVLLLVFVQRVHVAFPASAVPIVLFAWRYGPRAGALFGTCVTLINGVIALLVASPQMAWPGFLIGSAVGIALGYFVGRFAVLVNQKSSLLKAAFDATADGLLVLDRDGDVEIANRRFHVLWQLAPGAVTLDAMEARLAKPQELAKHMRALCKEPGEHTSEDLTLADGRVFETRSGAQEIDGVIVGRVWSFCDITERRRAEAARDNLYRAQKLDAVSRLAGGIAHDFNNLLGVILTHAHFALEELEDRAALEADIAQIKQATTRGSALTRQLLAFSSKQTLAPEVIDLNATTSDVEAMLRRTLGEHIQIIVKLDLTMGHVLADAGQIEQVILNLAVNARDAMPKGGTLSISTGACTIDGVAHALLTIGDSGCGMDENTRAHVFEPFFTTKSADKGTGLGLATVYGIVTQAKGRITLDSTLGVGTTVRISLPCTDAALPRKASALVSDASCPKATILLVEDEASLRAATERALRKDGHTVLSAQNAKEALAHVEQHRGEITLLLTDVVMPRMSGPVLAQHLLQVTPQLRVLFMSGYTADAVASAEVLAAGAQIIHKPFSPDDLRKRVRDSLLGRG